MKRDQDKKEFNDRKSSTIEEYQHPNLDEILKINQLLAKKANLSNNKFKSTF